MMTTTRIPERYRIPREDGGTLEEFTYDYEGEKKRALVYLPREARSDPRRRFPTLTLFHGGGDSEDSFFGGPEAASPFKPMLDCMIAEGTIAPLIVGKAIDNSALAIGGTSVIIVVGVALETVQALESQMLMRQYKGFLE